MNRRWFLAALAAGTAVAGCISDSSTSESGTTDGEPTTDRPTTNAPTTTRTATTTGTTTTTPEPTTAESTTPEPTITEPATVEPTTQGATETTITGAPGTPTDTAASDPTANTETPEIVDLQAAPGNCPTYGDDVVKVVCRDAAPSDAPMVMEPSSDALDLPGEVEFTFHNGTNSRFDTNFYSARLHKRVDDEWFYIAPRVVLAPLTPLAAGESYTWTVSTSREVQGLPTSSSSSDSGSLDTSKRSVGGLGGGLYAFGIDGNFEGGSHEQQAAFAATVELRGDPVELTTSDDISDVAVEDDVLTARLTGGYTESEDAREAVYVLERIDATPEGRLITEQLLQIGGIGPSNLPRDAFALITEHDVGEVRLTGPTTASPPFGVQGRVIEYEGTAYRVGAVEMETDA